MSEIHGYEDLRAVCDEMKLCKEIKVKYDPVQTVYIPKEPEPLLCEEVYFVYAALQELPWADFFSLLAYLHSNGVSFAPQCAVKRTIRVSHLIQRGKSMDERYMAPEHALGDPVGPPADCFASGILHYESENPGSGSPFAGTEPILHRMILALGPCTDFDGFSDDAKRRYDTALEELKKIYAPCPFPEPIADPLGLLRWSPTKRSKAFDVYEKFSNDPLYLTENKQFMKEIAAERLSWGRGAEGIRKAFLKMLRVYQPHMSLEDVL